jgi:hypothetical protein
MIVRNFQEYAGTPSLRRPYITFICLLIAAIASLILLLLIPRDPKNAFLIGMSLTRLVMAAVFIFLALGLSGIIWQTHRSSIWQERVQRFFSGSVNRRSLAALLYLAFFITFLLSVLFIVVWFLAGDRFGAILLRLSPVVLFVVSASALGLFTLSVYLPDLFDLLRESPNLIRRYRLSWILLLVGFYFIGSTYYQLAGKHAAEINQQLQFSDQKSYLVIAEKAYQTGFRYMGDRNRTPLYSYLLTMIYQPDLDREIFFERSKQFSIYLSLAMLIILFLISLKFLPTLQSAVLTTIIGTSLYVYKAGYVQPELMYYTLSFASFVLMLWMLRRPTIWLGVLTGAVAALAFYTKASMLPGLVLFVVVYLVQAALDRYRETRAGVQAGSAETFLRLKFLPLAAVLVVFLGLLSPYLLDNKRIFGRYFYNVNSTFYLWYDSWDEVEAGTNAHGDEVGWPDMPADQLPSLGKYFTEHTSQQIISRFRSGMRSQWENIATPYSRYSFPIIYSVVLLVFGLFNPRASLRLLVDYRYIVLFCSGYFLGYLVLYAWFSPVANFADERFTYSLYIPYLFSIFVALRLITQRVKRLRVGGLSVKTGYLLWAVHLAALYLAMLNFFEVAPKRLSKRWYGK